MLSFDLHNRRALGKIVGKFSEHKTVTSVLVLLVMQLTKMEHVVFCAALNCLKGHCHGHFLAFLVKWHQNYALVLSTMQEMLIELKGKDI